MTGRERETISKSIRSFGAFFQLERQARRARTIPELKFVIVNETHQLFRYHDAIFWQRITTGRVRIEAISGVNQPERHAPYPSWLKPFLEHLLRHNASSTVRVITLENIEERWREGWLEWLPDYGLWCPFITPGGDLSGGLWLTRESPWKKSEITLIGWLAEAYAHALQALDRQRGIFSRFRQNSRMRSTTPLRRSIRWGVLILLLALLPLPVRLSSLAPAQVGALEPMIVSAPIDGVIATVDVRPNQAVKTGELLLTLNDVDIQHRYEVAKRAVAVAEADYLLARQKAFSDQRSKAKQSMFQSKIAQKQLDVVYLEKLLQRIRIKAARDGIVIFRDINDWIGKPVITGEKIFTLADPARTILEIQLPVADAITLTPQSEILFFLNISPDEPIAARLHQAAYEAHVTPEGVLAFYLEALFNDGEETASSLRIGLQGTAKIYGETVTLFYYLMRRPLATLRQSLGW